MRVIRLPALLAAIALVLAACAPSEDLGRAALENECSSWKTRRPFAKSPSAMASISIPATMPGYASLFASDGVWTGGFGSAKGPAAIQEMLEKNLGKPEVGFVNKANFHLMTTAVVDVQGDTAKVRSRYLFFTASPR